MTGDVGYHAALDAIEMKKNIIDVGHFTENLVKDLLLDYISELNVEVIKSTVEKSPLKYYKGGTCSWQKQHRRWKTILK